MEVISNGGMSMFVSKQSMHNKIFKERFFNMGYGTIDRENLGRL